MKKKEWKRQAKNAELRAAGVTVSVQCDTMAGPQFVQIIQRGTSFQAPIITMPGCEPIMITVSVA